ncbi:hypothetical protein ACWEPL_09540 [Nonomuraea sp. NPDC004186]
MSFPAISNHPRSRKPGEKPGRIKKKILGEMTVEPNEVTEVLNRPLSRELLARDVTRLAYVAKDGTPRNLPIIFAWNGSEIVTGEDQPEPVVVDGADRLGRGVVVGHLSLLALVVVLDPVDGLAVGGGGRPGARVGGRPSAGHRSTAVVNASPAASSATEAPGQGATTRAHSS